MPGNDINSSRSRYASVIYVIFGSDNGLSPVRLPAIIWTNAHVLFIGRLVTNLFESNHYGRKWIWKCRLQWRPFCQCVNKHSSCKVGLYFFHLAGHDFKMHIRRSDDAIQNNVSKRDDARHHTRGGDWITLWQSDTYRDVSVIRLGRFAPKPACEKTHKYWKPLKGFFQDHIMMSVSKLRIPSRRSRLGLLTYKKIEIPGGVIRCWSVSCLTMSWCWSTRPSSSTMLSHWGRDTHICVSKLTIIVSDNGLSPGRRQAINWNNDILLIRPSATKFNEILIEIHTFFIQEHPVHNGIWKMAAILSMPLCVNFFFISNIFIQGITNQWNCSPLEPCLKHKMIHYTNRQVA